DLDLLAHIGAEFSRLRNPQCVGAGLELGEFIAAVGVAVDRGPDGILLVDQLDHHSSSRSPLADFTTPRGPPSIGCPLCAVAGAAAMSGSTKARISAVLRRGRLRCFSMGSSWSVRRPPVR